MAVTLLPGDAFLLQTVFGYIPTKYVGLYSDIAKFKQVASGGEVSFYLPYATFTENISN